MIVKDKKNRAGFTMIEIIVVLIIVSVMAALVIPSLANVVRKGKNREANGILLALYKAQLEYEVDTGSFAANLADLDIELPTNPKHFDPPTITSGTTVACGGLNQTFLASMDDADGNYTLYVLDDGRLVCTPCPGFCQRLGYPTF